MDPILFQVKSAIDSATRPMGILFCFKCYLESLQQKRNPSETKITKKCIVSPEIEVTILHNANLDLEVYLMINLLQVDFIKAKERGSKAFRNQS